MSVFSISETITGVRPPKIAYETLYEKDMLIGGIAETQEVLDFCAEHAIRCDIELLDIRNINQAYERMIAGDVKYRFVIDMATLQG